MVEIQAGDKSAVVTWEKNGKLRCIFLIKADDLTQKVKGLLGPMMKDVGGAYGILRIGREVQLVHDLIVPQRQEHDLNPRASVSSAPLLFRC